MTTAEIRQMIFEITGYQVGTKLNSGSMKEYLRFQITKRGNPQNAEFTPEQRNEIKKAINLPLFTNSNQIDIKCNSLK